MPDTRIFSIDIRHHGVFDDLKLVFNDSKPKDKAEIHILTGANGTGKTTLLRALTIFDVYYNEYWTRPENSKRREEILSAFPSEYSNSMNAYIEILFSKNEGFIYTSHLQADCDYTDLINYYNNISDSSSFHLYPFHFFCYSGNRIIESEKVEVFKESSNNPIIDALDFEKINFNSNLFQWIANTKTRAALAFLNGNTVNSDKYLKTLRQIEFACSKIIARKVEFIFDEYQLTVLLKIDDHFVPFNKLAEGYKSILSWLVDLMFRLDKLHYGSLPSTTKNFILFLDEIDIHLHPAAQRRILPVIQSLFPNAQIFLTTHSPFVIGSVDGAHVYKFKLDENGNSILDGEPTLSEDGKSYRNILNEILNVKEEFGIDIEKKLVTFYTKRDLILNNPEAGKEEFLKLAKELATQSEELNSIIGSELRQLSRITKLDYSI